LTSVLDPAKLEKKGRNHQRPRQTTDRSVERSGESNRLTELSHRARSPDFDLKKGVNEVLRMLA
jgi:hypothetical protein